MLMTNYGSGAEYLYSTTVPVLLDGKRLAGKLAMEIYVRHGLISHWIGCGNSFQLTAYAHKHPLPCHFKHLSDDILLKILLDFSEGYQGILALYPCSEEAQAFVERMAISLESHFVILSPDLSRDPLAPLVKKVY